MGYLIWALGGWCGTPPYWWYWWLRHLPPPPPPPDPWWMTRVLGIAGGIAGGWLVQSTYGAAMSDPMPGIIGAVIGGRVLSDIGTRLSPAKGA